jgi:hypothetical protein
MNNAARKTTKPETADMAQTGEKVAESVASFAGQSLDKAQETANKATEVAHGNVQMFDAAAGAMRSGMVELQLKTIEIAQANTDAAFSFLRDLLAVRDPQALVKANVEFVSRQSAEIARQIREINEVAAKCARDTTKPAQDGLARSFAELTKNFAA